MAKSLAESQRNMLKMGCTHWWLRTQRDCNMLVICLHFYIRLQLLTNLHMEFMTKLHEQETNGCQTLAGKMVSQWS